MIDEIFEKSTFEPLPERQGVIIGKNAVYIKDKETYNQFVNVHMRANIKHHIVAIGNEVLPEDYEATTVEDYLACPEVLTRIEQILGDAAKHANFRRVKKSINCKLPQ